MDRTTFLIFLGMYIYGFSLTLWAMFFDKHPTKKSVKVSTFGLIGLILTLFYFFYVLYMGGIK